MIARTGDIQLSGYLLISQILSIILISMYMYYSSILTLVNERYGSKQLMDLKELPRVTLGLIMVFYIVLSIIFVFLKYEVVAFIANDTNLINYATSILTFIIIANIFNPLHNVYKYALQTIGQSNYVLIKTDIINLITFVMMVMTIYVFNLNIFGVFINLFFNYVMLSIIFSRKYKGILNGIEGNKKKILA
nr:MATE family efflux transporter [Bacillus thuringiensis]